MCMSICVHVCMHACLCVTDDSVSMWLLIFRAVFFYAYASSKQFLNTVLTSDTTLVHIISAACAGFVETFYSLHKNLLLCMQKS